MCRPLSCEHRYRTRHASPRAPPRHADRSPPLLRDARHPRSSTPAELLAQLVARLLKPRRPPGRAALARRLGLAHLRQHNMHASTSDSRRRGLSDRPTGWPSPLGRAVVTRPIGSARSTRSCCVLWVRPSVVQRPAPAPCFTMDLRDGARALGRGAVTRLVGGCSMGTRWGLYVEHGGREGARGAGTRHLGGPLSPLGAVEKY